MLEVADQPIRRPSGVRQTAALFRVANYRLFWLGSVLYYTGIWMDQVVRTTFAYTLAGTALDLSIVAGVQGLAMGLLAIVGGTLADRVPKLRLMKWAQVVIVLDMGTTFTLVETHHIALWTLIGLTALFGGAIGISLPARLSFVSEIVDAENFVRAYGFYYVAFNLLNVVGPAIGGIIITHGGSEQGFGFMTVTHFLSWLMLLRIRPSLQRRTGPTQPFMTDLRSMFGLMSRSQRIALLMLMQGMSMAFVLSTTQLLPVFVRHVYGSDVGSGVGLLRASFGLGGLVGALAITQAARTNRKTRLLLMTGAIQGGLLVGFASTASIGLGVVMIVTLGMFQAVYLTLTSTLFATSVDDGMRGRVMSLYLLATVVQPLIVVPLGSLADAAGVQLTVALCGALFFSLSLAVALAFPGFRDIEEVAAPERPVVVPEPSRATAT